MGDIVVQGKGPFFNIKQAAAYCGWSPRYFAKLLKAYDVPRCGPRKNRFSREVLDRFMENPEAFHASPRGGRRRKPMTLVVPDECSL